MMMLYITINNNDNPTKQTNRLVCLQTINEKIQKNIENIEKYMWKNIEINNCNYAHRINAFVVFSIEPQNVLALCTTMSKYYSTLCTIMLEHTRKHGKVSIHLHWKKQDQESENGVMILL